MILGAFATEDELMHAVARVRNRGLGEIETHTPVPPESRHSGLKLVMLLAGLLGAAAGFGMQAYATGVAYPIDIGGRPDVFWPSYIPFTLETGLLAAMLAGFLCYLFVNRMPTLYEPVDEHETFHRASLDIWFLTIRTRSPDQVVHALELLRPLRPLRLEELPQ